MNGKRAVAIAILLVAVGVVFGTTTRNGFVRYDDDINLFENPRMLHVDAGSVANFWTGSYEGLYAPMTYTVWSGIASVAQRPDQKLDPTYFHVANIVVHAMAAIGVLLLLWRLGAGVWTGLAGAALFAVHPLVVEPVAWATGMKDVLSGCFCVWALVLYVSALKARATRRALMYGGALSFFVLAMLAKPQAAGLPVAAFAIDWLLVRRNPKRAAIWVTPWIACVIPIVLVARVAQPVANGETPAAVWQRPIVAADAVTFYLYKLIRPINLGPDYGRTNRWLMSAPLHYLPSIFIAALLATAAIALRRRAAWVAAATLVFLAGLLPVLGFSRFAFQRISNVADRYAYVALIGAAMAAAFGLEALVKRRRPEPKITAGITAVLLVILGFMSYRQCACWQNDESLFTHALEVNPASPVAKIHLATVRVSQDRFDEAEDLYRQSLADDFDGRAHFNLANLYKREGRLPEAVPLYRQAIERMRGHLHEADVHTNLGLTLLKMNDLDAGIAELRKSLELAPDNVNVWTALGQTLARKGDTDGAAKAFGRALEINPNFAPARAMLNSLQGRR